MVEISKRQQQIIKNMLTNQHYKTVKYYADIMHVSQRTLHNDLKALEIFLGNFGLILDKKPGLGIKISGDVNRKLQLLEYLNTQMENGKMNDLSPTDRQIQIAKMLLIDEKVLSYQSLSDLFFVSKSSIALDFETIRSFLNDNTVKIKGDHKGTYIIGTESQIQYSLKLFNEKIFKIKSRQSDLEGIDKFADIMRPFYPEEMTETVLHIVKKIEKRSTKPIAEYYLTTLFNTILVLCFRASKGKHHSKMTKNLIFDEVKNLKTYFIAKDILDEMNQKLSIHFTSEDIVYLNQHLIAIGFEPHFHASSITKEYKAIVKEIIRKMSSVLKVDLTNDRQLYEGLIAHLTPMIYRLRTGITVKNPLIKEIKEQYSVMLGVSWFVASMIEEKFDVKLTEDEVGFIMVHFQAALERNIKSKKVLIVCPTGLGTSELIANKVRQILPALCVIEVVPIEKLYQSNIDNVDFIISAIPIKITSKPVVYISPLVSNTDIKNVLHFYSDLFLTEKEEKDINGHHPKLEYLSKFIDEDSVFIRKKMRNKEEVLDFLIQKLKDNNDILEGFEESIYNREKMGSTALNTGVAIPHGIPKYVVNSKILILTNESMIEWWGGKKIDTIILLCISTQDLKNVKNVLSEIYHLIETRENVKKYFIDNTSEGILQLMKR
jgi:transcriptional antiterminator